MRSDHAFLFLVLAAHLPQTPGVQSLSGPPKAAARMLTMMMMIVKQLMVTFIFMNIICSTSLQCTSLVLVSQNEIRSSFSLSLSSSNTRRAVIIRPPKSSSKDVDDDDDDCQAANGRVVLVAERPVLLKAGEALDQ